MTPNEGRAQTAPPASDSGQKTWKKRRSIMTRDDVVMEDGRDSDIVIPVMGKTGVGKSTFINTLLGKERMEVGNSILSCTANIDFAVIEPASGWPKTGVRRVVIVDTPGFDDTYKDDAEILRRIAVWLASSYSDGMKLAGVIYLQNIAERRMDGTTRRNQIMFRKLCGTEALQGVILATTSWGEVSEEVGHRRETELKENFWRDMISAGSQVWRFEKKQESARAIVDAIIRKAESLRSVALRIQQELVDNSRFIPETDAGKELRYSLEELLQIQKDMIDDLDPEQATKLEQKMTEVRGQIKKLRLPWHVRIMRMFAR